MQNFNLSLFLEPRYQENILKFVREGGRLLFIGGDRALGNDDIDHLADIFPFKTESPSRSRPALRGLPPMFRSFSGFNEVLGSLVASPFQLSFPETEVASSSSARPLYD